MITDHHDARHKYSDGPVEDDILLYVTSGQDVQKVIKKDGRWPVLYHLSDIRRNLLEWYDFRPEGSLLEIGAGCGALTGLFCEKLKHVTAVELSDKRAEIVRKRHAKHENLTVYAGRLQDVKLVSKFDYITLIGVLEYASAYDERPDPHKALIRDCLGMLNPDGTLFVALENRLGIKYWAGAPEDHTGILFDGIMGYPSGQKVRTFDRTELLDLLSRAGARDVKMYYPWPDYKLPTVIYSDLRSPGKGALDSITHNYDQARYRLFDEGAVIDSLNADRMKTELANSFLAICRP